MTYHAKKLEHWSLVLKMFIPRDQSISGQHTKLDRFYLSKIYALVKCFYGFPHLRPNKADKGDRLPGD